MLAVGGACKFTGCCLKVEAATWGWAGGVGSVCGWVPAVLVGPQGETGVEGGVNGLNPRAGFLTQALRMTPIKNYF